MKMDAALNEVHLQRTYHIVFSTYKREPILLTEDAKRYINDCIQDISESKSIKIDCYKVLTDHVHILLVKQPNQTVPVLLQQIKGITTFKFFHEFPQVKISVGKSRLWNRGYNETLIKSEQQYFNTIRYIKNNFDKYRPPA